MSRALQCCLKIGSSAVSCWCSKLREQSEMWLQYLFDFFQTLQHEAVVSQGGQLGLRHKQAEADVQWQVLFQSEFLGIDQCPVI